MTASVDWSAVREAHHDDGTGRCTCGAKPCSKREMAAQVRRFEEQALLPGPPAEGRPFQSVFIEVGDD